MACLACFDPLPLGSGSAGHTPTITPFGGDMVGCPPQHEIACARPPTGLSFATAYWILNLGCVHKCPLWMSPRDQRSAD